MSPKQRAAEAALGEVRDGMVVGLGTGSTADFFIQALAAALRSGRLRDVRGVPTSLPSERRARELGIPLLRLDGRLRVDLTVDGADEIDPQLDLIKGLGGALLREKIVAQNSSRLVIIADMSKCVPALGTKSPLPVEVVPFAYEAHEEFFRKLGSVPVLRRGPDGGAFVTDNGNHIYDCKFNRIDHPRQLESDILHRAGVIDCGLFLGLAGKAIVADDQGLREMHR